MSETNILIRGVPLEKILDAIELLQNVGLDTSSVNMHLTELVPFLSELDKLLDEPEAD